MDIVVWKVRRTGEIVDLDTVYSRYENFFSLKVHHGGHFETNPVTIYAGGWYDFIDYIHKDDLTMEDIGKMLHKLGVDGDTSWFIHFLEPGKDLVSGLKLIKSDEHLGVVSEWLKMQKVIEMYVEEGFSSHINIEEVNCDSGLGEVGRSGVKNVSIRDIVEFGEASGSGVKTRNLSSYVTCDDANIIDELEENFIRKGAEINDVLLQSTESHSEDGYDALSEASTEDSNFEPGVENIYEVKEGDDLVENGNQNLVEMNEINERVNKEVNEIVSDYNSSEYAGSDDLRSLCTTDEEGEFNKWNSAETCQPQFNMSSDLKDPKFEVGMSFKSADDVRGAIHAYAIRNRRNVIFKKNDKLRIRAIYRGNVACPWSLQVSWSEYRQEWEIRTHKSEHMCNKIRRVKYATSEWLAREHIENIRANPGQSVQAFKTYVHTVNGLEITGDQAYRARRIAEHLIYGNHKEQYSLLRDYLGEVNRSNPGSTIKLEFEEYNENDPTRQFKRVYVCLGALKAGFNAGCRKVLGFDGAFLKGVGSLQSE